MGMLAEVVARGPVAAVAVKCGTCKWLATLDPETRAEAEAMLAPDSGWEHVQIADAVRPLGLNLVASSIGRHRGGGCVSGRAR